MKFGIDIFRKKKKVKFGIDTVDIFLDSLRDLKKQQLDVVRIIVKLVEELEIDSDCVNEVREQIKDVDDNSQLPPNSDSDRFKFLNCLQHFAALLGVCRGGE